MDGISRSRGWDKEIPHCVFMVLPMEQLVLSDKWARKPCYCQLKLRVALSKWELSSKI